MIDREAQDAADLADKFAFDAAERGESAEVYLCRVVGTVIGAVSVTDGAGYAIELAHAVKRICDHAIAEIGKDLN
ncbi:hypothetical protein LZ016_13855 [Sphingomonas sp. SM33]|uniref:IclR-ED domain-containing protein n=1 Tax=Sphingomonas telluris TaxID=2907998 RepID=A0ABS9VR38_9SPHN|nr:hypothetical protein [Sphingomonas telluris]MCH8617178.1 hypothetical protein [Sphingomonas telluris]